ncbi:hypothetical protein ACWN8P_12585 [Vagococcus salmoninarum]|uniref:Transcriptional regulator n=1 Tax=Vagococcus salmoninarum TaxID=2739 RepID=A0A429ZSJ7_9ENTE|nr:hypothetical protein [Vagococcus salmoninarum]RST96645.1 hypothetical protein CBF35_05275 [Vagococcus salmoninarum]
MSKKNDKLMNELENRFSDYKNIPNNINKQKMSLQASRYQEEDENVGGSRGSRISNPTERVALMYLDDPYIMQQEKDKKAIRETLDELGKIESSLIERKYWGDCSWMTWKEFSKEVHYSSSSISRLKQKTLMIFGRKINRLGSWD